ncbi:hypothetical protein BDY24DRAFT_398497 [Mrakia frigida]|uniref:uncharacterized protein n=1 Tax=Mrakia frigida TaxID=29902 RepID=UPI003FCC249C
MQIAGLYRLKGVGRWKTLVGRQEKISVLVVNCPGPVFTLTLIDERPSLLKSTQSFTDLQQEIRILRECVERTSRHTSPEQHRRRIEDAKERLRRHLQIIENNQEKEEVKLTLYVARLTSAEDELEERREEIVREVGGGRGPVTPPRRASRASSRGRSASPSPSPLFRLGQGGSSRLG